MQEPGQPVSFRVFGRVQGVGFRYFTKQKAQALAIRGWVKNEADGSVLIHAFASQSTLEAFRDCLRQGPPFSKVTRIEEATLTTTDLSEAKEFQILR